jgi:drug/metabolite transporter (DMT)-like permease
MVFAGACSFGILSTFVKLSYHEGYTAAEISFTQALTGMVVLWLIYLAGNKKKQSLTRKDVIWLLLTGASIGCTSWVYYLSVVYIPASVAIVILMQFTWIGLLIDWTLFRKRPSGLQLLTTGMILLGTWMGSGLAGGAAVHLSFKGLLFAGISALVYAIYVVANSRVGKEIPVQLKSAGIMTGSTLFIFLINAPALVTSAHYNAGLLKWALFLSLFGTIIPPLVFAKGIPKIGVGVSAVIMTAELPVAILCSHLILHERVDAVQWGGVVLMLLSMVLLNVRYLRK